MESSTKISLSLFAAFIIFLIILILWLYYSVFQKDSYFFDLVGPPVCDPACENNSKCVPGFGCLYPHNVSKLDQSVNTTLDQSNNINKTDNSNSTDSDNSNVGLYNCLKEERCACAEFGQGRFCQERVEYISSPVIGVINIPDEQVDQKTCQNGSIVGSNIFKKTHEDGLGYISLIQMTCKDGILNYILSDHDTYNRTDTRILDSDIHNQICKNNAPFVGFRSKTHPDNGRLVDLSMVCPEDLPLPVSNSDGEHEFICPEGHSVSSIAYVDEYESQTSKDRYLRRFGVRCSEPKEKHYYQVSVFRPTSV